MTDPPQECPTRTTSPSARSIARLVAVTSSARDVVGFCTEMTLYPLSTSGLMILLQEEPSAQSPWTKTIVGFAFMEAPVCANAFEPSDKTPTNNRVPIFFIHASNCIGKVASTDTAARFGAPFFVFANHCGIAGERQPIARPVCIPVFAASITHQDRNLA